MAYNKLLERQLAKFVPQEFLDNPTLKPFYDAVSEYYYSIERDKRISEHAFTISEREYQEVVADLRQQNHVIHQTIQQLKEAIEAINPDHQYNFTSKEGEIFYVVEFLKAQIAKSKEIENYLITARNEAENAARAKSDFLSVMSHEIRTPLNAIIGYIHLLINENPLPAQVQYLNILQVSARNLLSLINDVLDFSKIEEGKIVFNNSDFDIRLLLNDVKMAHKMRAEENGNILKVMLDDEIPTFVKGDTTRLTQILNNLISNAIKFTKNGRITVTLQLKSIKEKHCEVYFSVSDTGIGISDENQKKIFDRFTQAHQYITREYGGSGLGLAIIKKLLNLMDADIFVESMPGKGSNFYFTLNFEISATPNFTNDKVLEIKEDLGGIRILLVEDVFFNALLAKKMLNNMNAEVVIAENGLVAVELVRKEHFDLILMDVQMPVMDGYTASMEIRKFNLNVPIFPLTASTSQGMQERFASIGITDFIFKPINPDNLFTTIQRKFSKIMGRN